MWTQFAEIPWRLLHRARNHTFHHFKIKIKHQKKEQWMRKSRIEKSAFFSKKYTLIFHRNKDKIWMKENKVEKNPISKAYSLLLLLLLEVLLLEVTCDEWILMHESWISVNKAIESELKTNEKKKKKDWRKHTLKLSQNRHKPKTENRKQNRTEQNQTESFDYRH